MKNSDHSERLRNAQNYLKASIDNLKFKADPEVLDILDDVLRDIDIVATDLEIQGNKEFIPSKHKKAFQDIYNLATCKGDARNKISGIGIIARRYI